MPINLAYAKIRVNLAKAIVFVNHSNYGSCMSIHTEVPLFLSIPHSGEKIPPEVHWLTHLPEVTLMRDVDRYVDQLYQKAILESKLPTVIAEWHRYVVDLNRLPDQYDASAVNGAKLPAGKEPKGLHWSVTTFDEVLISEPMSQELHQDLVKSYYQPFHDSIIKLQQQIIGQFGQVFHLDLHSMPSVGTELHPDPGETRAEIVVSDFHGKSAKPEFKEIVMTTLQEVGFQVAYNWPYIGGGITRMYGKPDENKHTIQIEINRQLYMNEETKKIKKENLEEMQKTLCRAIVEIQNKLRSLV